MDENDHESESGKASVRWCVGVQARVRRQEGNVESAKLWESWWKRNRESDKLRERNGVCKS